MGCVRLHGVLLGWCLSPTASLVRYKVLPCVCCRLSSLPSFCWFRFSFTLSFAPVHTRIRFHSSNLPFPLMQCNVCALSFSLSRVSESACSTMFFLGCEPQLAVCSRLSSLSRCACRVCVCCNRSSWTPVVRCCIRLSLPHLDFGDFCVCAVPLTCGIIGGQVSGGPPIPIKQQQMKGIMMRLMSKRSNMSKHRHQTLLHL